MNNDLGWGRNWGVYGVYGDAFAISLEPRQICMSFVRCSRGDLAVSARGSKKKNMKMKNMKKMKNIFLEDKLLIKTRTTAHIHKTRLEF